MDKFIITLAALCCVYQLYRLLLAPFIEGFAEAYKRKESD
ncbi:hypothetical protein JCM19233_1246 [Vibrio astriarenae]|nr:hypothetical protein JCM19233_1246 [Vibrio sp. C7]